MFGIIVAMYSDTHAGFNFALAAAFRDAREKHHRSKQRSHESVLREEADVHRGNEKKKRTLSSRRSVRSKSALSKIVTVAALRRGQADRSFEVKLGFKERSN